MKGESRKLEAAVGVELKSAHRRRLENPMTPLARRPALRRSVVLLLAILLPACAGSPTPGTAVAPLERGSSPPSSLGPEALGASLEASPGGFSAGEGPADLEARLQDRIHREGDTIHISLALLDLEDGTRIEIDAHRRYHAASTMKVPVLLELYRQTEAAGGSVEENVLVTNTFRSIYDGTPFILESDRDEALLTALGGELPARRIAEGMIQVSSNLGTNILLEHLTPDSVQATMHRIGAEGMEVLRGVSDIPAFEAGLSNRTTAYGYLRTLEVIASCELTDREACREMMEILEGQQFTREIPAGIPPEARARGTRVGNKTGSITGILHDGAIVRPHHRDPYLLVILTEGYQDRAVGSATMAELSGMVWNHLTRTP